MSVVLLPDQEVELISALINENRFEEAVFHAKALSDANQHSAHAWKMLGFAQLTRGDVADAISALKNGIALDACDADLHGYLGVACHQIGLLKEAEAHYRRALELAPDTVALVGNLAINLQDQGRTEEAESFYCKLLNIDQNSVMAFNNLGLIQFAKGEFSKAEASFRSAITLAPILAEAHNNLGNALYNQGRSSDAVASFCRAVELRPDYAEAYSNLGGPLKSLGRLAEAESCLRRAIDINPNYAEAHNNLGLALNEQGRLMEAEVAYCKALTCAPRFADAYSNLGNLLKDMGRFAEAEESLRNALVIAPNFWKAYDNLLYLLNFGAEASYAFAEAREYGRRVGSAAKRRFSTWQNTAPEKTLRMGIVSGDLRKHPVGYFLDGILAQIDHSRIELVAYPTHVSEDQLTSRIRKCFSEWKPLVGLSDEAAATQIHSDGIDVLLDLSGHTAHNRLPVFAWKPAPVQASWLGYFATTGVQEVTYLIADELGLPVHQHDYFTERIWYLPHTRLCFTPPHDAPPVSPLPAILNGYVTLGCFQPLAKVSNEILAVWGQIFSALPTAHLRWQCKQFGDVGLVSETLLRLEKFGLTAHRVALQSSVSRADYLAAHANVDMILDTFPYPGGTTTCEALWMGVPTLTLCGETLLARQGASLLTAAGLDAWVAESLADYHAKAIAFASDVEGLFSLRCDLRDRVAASPIFDVRQFAINLESALWGMYNDSCRGP